MRKDIQQQADAIRAAMNTAGAVLTDEQAAGAKEIYPLWKAGTDYGAGDRVRYGDLLYKCLTEHTSQDSWAPNVSPSLWVRIDDPAIEWPQWRQPTGSEDAYAKGAKVSHKEKHWVSDVDANTWEPGVFGWTEYTG